MEPNPKRRMPEGYVTDMHRQPGQEGMRPGPSSMQASGSHVNGHINGQPRHGPPVPVPPGDQGPADAGHDLEIPRDRSEEWNGLVSMMTVIHAMVEKVYQAMCMLRETEQQDRANWMAYTQHQRNEASHAAAAQANHIISSAMGKAEETIQRRPYSPNVEQHPPAGHEPRPVAHAAPAPVPPRVVVESAPRGSVQSAVPVPNPPQQQQQQQQQPQAPSQPQPQQPSQQQQPSSQVPPDQPHSTAEDEETCWNCGREATETCSRCKKARYCGVWCQRRDWKMKHHRVCREAVPEEPAEPSAKEGSMQQHGNVPMEDLRVVSHAAEDRSADAHQDAQRGDPQQPVVYVQDPNTA